MSSMAAIMPDRKRSRIRSTTFSASMAPLVAVACPSDLQFQVRCCRESSGFASQKGHAARCLLSGAIDVIPVASSVSPPSMSSRIAVRWESPPLIAARASMVFCSSASRSVATSYLLRSLLGHAFFEL